MKRWLSILLTISAVIYLPAIPGNSAEQLQFRGVATATSTLSPGTDFVFSIEIYSSNGIKRFSYFARSGKSKSLWNSSSKLISKRKSLYRYELTVKVPAKIKLGSYLGWIEVTDKKNLKSSIPESKVTLIKAENVNQYSDTNNTSENGSQPKPLDVSQRIPFSLPITCDESRGECPKENFAGKLLPSTECKINDLTNNFGASIAFPRPQNALLGRVDIRILVLVYEFRDKFYSESAYSKLKKEALGAEEFYSRLSYGKAKLSFVFPEKRNWTVFPNDIANYASKLKDLDSAISFVLSESKQFNFDEYDAIYMHSPIDYPKDFGTGGTGMQYRIGEKLVPRVYLAGGNSEGFGGYDHGLGHLLFYLEDIYDINANGGDRNPASWWDVMSGGGDFFGWSKFLNGWLNDDQVVCLDPALENVSVRLEDLGMVGGKKLAVIPTESGKALVIEYRKGRVDSDLLSDGICNTGHCWLNRQEGLLVYFVDTSINHLQGPIRMPLKLKSEAMSVGQTLEFRGFTVSFKAKGQAGAYFNLSRT